MTMVLTWPDRRTRNRPTRGRLLRRLAVLLRLVARRQARRRVINRVLAETHDPEALADIGIRVPPPSPVERWVGAMLWHRR